VRYELLSCCRWGWRTQRNQ